MTEAEAWFWFYILPMAGVVGLIGFLWSLSVKDWPSPESDD